MSSARSAVGARRDPRLHAAPPRTATPRLRAASNAPRAPAARGRGGRVGLSGRCAPRGGGGWNPEPVGSRGQPAGRDPAAPHHASPPPAHAEPRPGEGAVRGTNAARPGSGGAVRGLGGRFALRRGPRHADGRSPSARGEPARSRRPLGLRRARQTPQEGGERPARRGRAFRARRGTAVSVRGPAPGRFSWRRGASRERSPGSGGAEGSPCRDATRRDARSRFSSSFSPSTRCRPTPLSAFLAAPPPPSRRLQRRCPPAPPRPRKSRAEEESPGRRRPSAATSGRCRPAGPRCSSTRRHVAAPGALPAAATHRPHRARPHGVLTVPPAASHGAQPRAVPTAAAGSLGRPACPCHPWLAVPVLLGPLVAAAPLAVLQPPASLAAPLAMLQPLASLAAAPPLAVLQPPASISGSSSPQQPRLPAGRSRAGSPERAV